MTNEFIKVNGGDLVPLPSVKRIREVTAEDRDSLTSLGPHVDASKFNTRFEFADGRKSFASEDIAAITAQGVAVVEVDDGAYVIADNIIKARDLTPQDLKEIEDKTGRELREGFRSQVETKAGVVLATIDAAKIMHRMAHTNSPLNPVAQTFDHP
ncbi:MAG: hypothetical protein AAF221_07925 [Pseudomonadota bacterium]